MARGSEGLKTSVKYIYSYVNEGEHPNGVVLVWHHETIGVVNTNPCHLDHNYVRKSMT